MHPSCVNDVMLQLALGSARAYTEEWFNMTLELGYKDVYLADVKRERT
jgi:hypothetical protein